LLALANSTQKLNKRSKRRLLRWGIVGGNLLLLVLVGAFVLANRSASQTVRASTLNGAVATAASVSKPLDTLSSAQIALTAAQMTDLPELTAIHNQADSDSLILSVVPNDSSTLAKPQIVSTALKSRQDIIHYTTVAGDTVDSLSAKFGVSAQSIRWSNNISGSSVSAGLKLVIPPVNGIVYTVKSGDTPASLASKYQADEGQIITLNDAEINGLKSGEQVIIPNGRIAVAAVSYGLFIASYGGNGYAYGYCTYYAASRVSVPTNWGNANTWDDYARLSGWTVSSRPVAGAIAQSDIMSYLGHVAYVEAVSADGSQIKYSDMNGISGWGRVGFSDWVPASVFQHYIYH
jgi:N-acetylmuramoyl-L-alanine amidase